MLAFAQREQLKYFNRASVLPQIISGNNEAALTKSHEFFENLSDEVPSWIFREAEIIKLFNNTYRDATFVIAITFNLLSQFSILMVQLL